MRTIPGITCECKPVSSPLELAQLLDEQERERAEQRDYEIEFLHLEE